MSEATGAPVSSRTACSTAASVTALRCVGARRPRDCVNVAPLDFAGCACAARLSPTSISERRLLGSAAMRCTRNG